MHREQIQDFALRDNSFIFHACHVFHANGKKILVNGKAGTIFVCDENILNQIKAKTISDDLQFKLIQRGFASVDGHEDFGASPEILPQFFIIDFTRACNLRCVYCFRHLENNISTISAGMLDKIIDYLLLYASEHRIRDIYIQPWGGEPLIAFERIKQLHRRLTDGKIRFKITIETNGCLVTPSIARQLNEMDIGVGVSLDGLPEIHDSQRPTAAGKPSFEAVLKGINNLWDAGFRDKLGFVTVLTRNNKDDLNNILDYYVAALDINKFKLNVVKDSPNLQDKGICLSPAEYAELQLTLLNKLLDLHRKGYSITEFNIRDKLLNLLIRGKTNICISQGCLGGTKLIGFDQSGNIYPCDLTDLPEFSLGNIEDGDLILLISESRKTNEFFTRKWSLSCGNCPWWFYCKGGCTSSLKYRRNKIEGVDPFECAANRTLYPALLNLIETDPEVLEPLTQTSLR
ncbi:MAG: radical SAM protein [Calditrichia bacterium]